MGSLVGDEDSLFEFVVKKGNGIKGLVDLGVTEVPKLYIQPPDMRIEKPSSDDVRQPHFALKPIDLSKLDDPEECEEVKATIARAAETLGFFQVVNHGMDLEFLESVISSAHRFFEQPLETKAAYLKGVSPSPLVKYTTSFVPEKEEVLQWRDFMNLRYTNDSEALSHWPEVCRVAALEYVKSTSKMVRKLFEVLVESLGVELEESKLESLAGGRVVTLNYYPPCPNPDITIGVARHSDAGLLTVLLQDGNGGLFVKSEKEEWIEISPIPGALVVNVGDALEILSNGRYRSAEHGARTTNTQARVSIPLFVAPLLTETVGPFPELVERDGGSVYKEVLYQDYMNSFWSKGHDGKKSLDFAKLNPNA